MLKKEEEKEKGKKKERGKDRKNPDCMLLVPVLMFRRKLYLNPAQMN